MRNYSCSSKAFMGKVPPTLSFIPPPIQQLGRTTQGEHIMLKRSLQDTLLYISLYGVNSPPSD